MTTVSYPFDESQKSLIRETLDRNGVMVFPTETFYAIGCLATSPEAVEKVYSLKQRKKDAPLLVLIDSWEMLDNYADRLSESVRAVLQQYWPGALTAVLRHKGRLASTLNIPGESLGFRMTSSKIARELIGIAKSPLVGTSANITKGPEASEIGQTQEIFGDSVDLYIDGGKTAGGSPSTVVDMTNINNFRILRQGTLTFDPKLS